MDKPKTREDFRDLIAQEFIKSLEENELQWHKGWITLQPYNGISHYKYTGINRFWLSFIASLKGSTDPRWYTMVQIMDKSNKYHKNETWHLKAGSKATYVEYWYQYDLVEKKTLSWKEYQEEIDSGRSASEFRLTSKYTGVFNAMDIEGISPLSITTHTSHNLSDIIHKIADGMQVTIAYDGGERAYYSPTSDKIHLPLADNFVSEYELNATAAHELGHATGHTSRLNRAQLNMFGSPEYAYEELVAEMCSCFVSFNYSDHLTDVHLNNHKAYVQSWIQAIREKPETLTNAIKDAQAAADYMEKYLVEETSYFT